VPLAAQHHHRLAASWMMRIRDPHFRSQTPGIITLLRVASANRGSPVHSGTAHVATIIPFFTSAYHACSAISRWRAAMDATPG